MSDRNCKYAQVIPRAILIFGGNNVRCAVQEKKRFTRFGTKYYPCEADDFRKCEIYLNAVRGIDEDRDEILDEIGFGD